MLASSTKPDAGQDSSGSSTLPDASSYAHSTQEYSPSDGAASPRRQQSVSSVASEGGQDLPPMPASVAALHAPNGNLTAVERVDKMFTGLLLVDPQYVAKMFAKTVVEVDKADWAAKAPDTIEAVLRIALDRATPQFWAAFHTDAVNRRSLIARLRNWMAHLVKLKLRERTLPAIKTLVILKLSAEEFDHSKLAPVLKILRKTVDETGKAADSLGRKFRAFDGPSEAATAGAPESVPTTPAAPAAPAEPVAKAPLSMPRITKKRVVAGVHEARPGIDKAGVAPVASAAAVSSASSPSSSASTESSSSAGEPTRPLATAKPLPSFAKPAKRTEAESTVRLQKLQVDVERARSTSDTKPAEKGGDSPTKAAARPFSSIGDLKAQIGKRSRRELEAEAPTVVEVEVKKPKKNKKVHWESDDKLVSVRYFETNTGLGSLRSSRGAKDVEEGEGATAMSNRTMLEWYTPREILIDGSRLLDVRMLDTMSEARYGRRKPESYEAGVQQAREAKVLMAVYDEHNLPENPAEPPYENVPAAPPTQMAAIKPAPGPRRPEPAPVAQQRAPTMGQGPGMFPSMFPNMMPGMPMPGMMMPGFMMNMGNMNNMNNMNMNMNMNMNNMNANNDPNSTRR